MRVHLERTGGFAGIRINRDILSDELSDQDRDRLQSLVNAAGFFELPEVMRASQPDRFQYKVTVESDQRKRTVCADEAVVPQSLRPLLDWIVKATPET
jgi:hypothetical protein